MRTRRGLLAAVGVGIVSGIAGCSGDTGGNTTDPGAAPAGNNESTPDQSEETPREETTKQNDQTTDDEQTFNIETPVDAPFYDESVRNADPRDFHGDTEELRNAVEQGGYQGAEAIGRLFEGQTSADSAHAAAQILHQNGNTDYVIDAIPGQINASDQEYIFIQPVENGQLLEPVIAGQAYDGFEVYNPENPEQASTSMQRLVDDGDWELSLPFQMNSILRYTEGLSDEAVHGTMETFLDNYSASLLGVTEEDNIKLRPETYEDGFIQAVSRGLVSPEVPEELEEEISDDIANQDFPYRVAEGLQQEFKGSRHHRDEGGETYDIQVGERTQYDFQDAPIDSLL